MFYLPTRHAEPRGLCSAKGQDPAAVGEGVFLCEASSSRTFFSWGPLRDKRRPLWPYFCSIVLSSLSPSSLGPGLSTRCRHTESNCCSQAVCRSGPPRSATEPPWPGIPAWWVGRGVGRGVGAQGGAETTPGPLCSALRGGFLPQRPACPPGESYRLSGPRNAPLIGGGVFLVSDAWLFSQLFQILASNTSNSGQPSVTF